MVTTLMTDGDLLKAEMILMDWYLVSQDKLEVSRQLYNSVHCVYLIWTVTVL